MGMGESTARMNWRERERLPSGSTTYRLVGILVDYPYEEAKFLRHFSLRSRRNEKDRKLKTMQVYIAYYTCFFQFFS